jgi:predicted metal-binding protein
MTDTKTLEALFRGHGFNDFRWIDPKDIVVAAWVRMKCRFGCDEYGRNACCPPNVPPLDECERFFQDYKRGVIFRFEKTVDKPEDRHAWTRVVNAALSKMEREVFLSGRVKAFLLFMDSCTLCAKCAPSRAECKKPMQARPSPEAMGIDVFSTVLKSGYPIEVLSDYSQQMNRYAILLVD